MEKRMENNIREKEEKFVDKLMNSLINGMGCNNDNILFVKHYNTFDLSAEKMNEIKGKYPKDVLILHHDFAYNGIQGPFEPFLDHIKEAYDTYYKESMSAEEFVAACDVYKPVRSIFADYLMYEDVEKREQIIIPEIAYERKKIADSVINILKYITNEHRMVLVLNRAHFARKSTLFMIRKYMQLPKKIRLGILITYNDVHCIEGKEREDWDEVIATAQEKNNIVDYNIMGESGVANGTFTIKEEDIELFIKKIKLLVKFGCSGQALRYLEQISEEMESNNIEISRTNKLIIMLEYIYAALCEGDYICALKYSDKVKNIIVQEESPQLKFYYYYNLCMLYIYQYGRDIPVDLAKAFEENAKRTNDDYCIFIYRLTMYMSKFRGLKELFLCDFDFPIEEEFLEEMHERGYLNHLSYFYMFGYENDARYFKDSIDSIKGLEKLTKGLNIAKELDNSKLIMEGYKKCITVCSTIGNFEPMEYYYKLCLETAEHNEDIANKVDLYNGLGYNLIVRGSYEKAYNYFNEALSIQLQNHAHGMEIVETLYNMAINAFMCADYYWTDRYMNYVVKIMSACRTQKMKLCSISKIYGIIAVANFYMGIDYNCDLYKNLLKRIVSPLLEETNEAKFAFWDDDLAFYFILKALIAKREGDYDQSDRFFNRVYFHMQRSSSAKAALLHIYTYEYTDVLRKLNKSVEAERLVKDVYTYYTSNRAENIALEIMDRIHNRGNELPFKSNKVDVSLKRAEEKQLQDELNRTKINNLLEEKTKNLSFVSSWQDMLNNENNTSQDVLLSEAVSTLNSNFGVQGEIIIEVINDRPKAIYMSDDVVCDEMDIEYIVTYFDRIRTSCVVNTLDRSYDEHTYLMSALRNNNISTMVGVPIIRNGSVKFVLLAFSLDINNRMKLDNVLTDQSKIMITYAFGQLVDAIYRMRDLKEIEIMNNKLASMNEMLTSLAEHDFLTNMYNRNGLNKIISKISVGQIALGFPNKDEKIAVLYIDLDNFKYFNDTFGHTVGDKILKEFANLCIRSVGSRGYGVRYGGDEFIIIVPQCNEEDAIEIATYINEELENDRFYKNVKVPKKELEIARRNDKMLSSSVGIAFCTCPEEEAVYDAIKKADIALYEVKKKTKNGYSIFGK